MSGKLFIIACLFLINFNVYSNLDTEPDYAKIASDEAFTNDNFGIDDLDMFYDQMPDSFESLMDDDIDDIENSSARFQGVATSN